MIEIGYYAQFIKDFKNLDRPIKDEVLEKIELFKDPKNHERLRVHKLKGRLAKYYAFSITYQHRVVFEYLDAKKTKVVLSMVGTHKIYN